MTGRAMPSPPSVPCAADHLEALRPTGFAGGEMRCDQRALVMAGAEVVVIHETDGRKYLEALLVLAARGELSHLTFRSASVAWRFLHAMVRERQSLGSALWLAGGNLLFRLRMPFLRNKIIILAIAPWDYRLLLHSILLRHNRIIYNTSWPWWDGGRVPRRYGVFSAPFRLLWRKMLASPRVVLTTVTPAAASGLAKFLPGRVSRVIPHPVSEEFSGLRARHAEPFRLLFVGELSEKKGFREFASVLSRLDGDIGCEIFGNGPLCHLATALAERRNCRWHGHVTDRKKLAAIAAECQVFLSPAQKTPNWEELFGMAVVEAMALGLPCIVTNHVGPRGLIRHGVDGVLVEEGDLQAAMSWILLLREQSRLWREMSGAAVKAAARFSLPSVVQRWREALSEAAEDFAVETGCSA